MIDISQNGCAEIGVIMVPSLGEKCKNPAKKRDFCSVTL